MLIASNSDTPAMGIQCRRSKSPIGVPGPTWVSFLFCSSLNMSCSLKVDAASTALCGIGW